MQKKYSIEDMKDFALNKNGKCLSKEYKNAHTKLNWECNNRHHFSNTWNVVQQGTWCKQCTNEARKGRWINQFGNANQFQINELNKLKVLAKSKDGDCLSDIFVSSLRNLKWKCEKGHIWEQKWSHIKKGVWCPTCYREKQKLEWHNQFGSFKNRSKM
jgi:hypothetical protein